MDDRPDCGIGRRQFIKHTGVIAAGLAATGHRLPAIAGPFGTSDHFVPADKKLRAEWLRALFDRGEPTWYQGKDLATIGMPVGGVCAGQLYLSGDGRLICWGIFNDETNSGYGQVNYEPGRLPTIGVMNVREFKPHPVVEQGFAVRVRRGAEIETRNLDQASFPAVRFCGEYPIGTVEYRDAAFPVTTVLEAFSPFVPLNTADSSLPATLLRFRLTNTSDDPLEVSLAGWLENAVCRDSAGRFPGRRVNRVVSGDDFEALVCSANAFAPVIGDERPPRLLADFEGDDYAEWRAEGQAFGTAPARGALEGQQPVKGYLGRGLVNTFLGGGDQLKGRLVSPPFLIDRRFITFLVGGGSHQHKTCINLIVDGEAVRTACGRSDEALEPYTWFVEELEGQRAHLEIVDEVNRSWGHINVDHIELRDSPVREGEELRHQADFGSMALAVLGDHVVGAAAGQPFENGRGDSGRQAECPLTETIQGTLHKTVELAPGATEEIVFTLAWHLPNRRHEGRIVGNYYARQFTGALDVVRHVAAERERLTAQTRLWHDSFYRGTLPRWLLDRVGSTLSILASNTCQRRRNGRFWAFEGVGCCHGTCGHVWNYAQAMARLFPDLERSVREMQDFRPGVGMDPETGAISFRGEGWGRWAGDSQAGYILKAWREHLMSADASFLERNWPQVKHAMEFLIAEDGNGDGILEGRQHQTYDQDYYGANTMVGSLYLAALRAAERMAEEVGENDFAERCRSLHLTGSEQTVERLFNGEYFVQDVDLSRHPEWQYGDGCLADQLFGQAWARQTGLGSLYPEDTVHSALRSIWKYCWAPDVGPQNGVHKPERWFAHPGEAGLFTCTWPSGQHLGPGSTRYRNEVWTGIEYQVAAHMAFEGMVTEALVLCRGVHERYHPSRHNPWNEIECGDHYARALASWGMLIGLSGFESHGPGHHLAFAPRITPDDFRGVFTAAEGWGHLVQRRGEGTQVNRIEVHWGQLDLKSLAFEVAGDDTEPAAQVTVNGKGVESDASLDGRRVSIELGHRVRLAAGDSLEVGLQDR